MSQLKQIVHKSIGTLTPCDHVEFQKWKLLSHSFLPTMYLHRAFIPHLCLPYSHPHPFASCLQAVCALAPLIHICHTHPPLCLRCRECMLSSMFAILTPPFVSSSCKETKEAGKLHASDDELEEQQDAMVDPPNTNLISGLPHSWTPCTWAPPLPCTWVLTHTPAPTLTLHSNPMASPFQPLCFSWLQCVFFFFLHGEWLTGIRIATSFFTDEYQKSTFHT